MKRFFMFVVMMAMVLMLAFPVMAQVVWHPANQLTVAWDAVTQDVDGDPLPADFDLRYKLYVANAKSDPNHETPIEVGDIAHPTLQATLTLPAKGQYYVGVQAVLVGVETELLSSINWAHESEGQDGELWAAIFIANPNFPHNLVKQ